MKVEELYSYGVAGGRSDAYLTVQLQVSSSPSSILHSHVVPYCTTYSDNPYLQRLWGCSADTGSEATGTGNRAVSRVGLHWLGAEDRRCQWG